MSPSLRPEQPLKTRRLVLLLLLAETLAAYLDLRWGPWARIHYEEYFNIRQGLQAACGHETWSYALQYRSFCGGCSAEAWGAALLFELMGPSVLAWKLVPTFFHLITFGMGLAIAERLGGSRALLLFGLAFLAAPGFYRDLSHTGWGNHVEGMSFVLSAGYFALRARAGAWSWALLSGAVLGLGIWFCHTAAHALPAILLLLWGRGWGRLSAFLSSLVLGFAPWLDHWQSQPDRVGRDADKWLSWELASPERLADWLMGPQLLDGLWSASDYGALHAWGWIWWPLALLLAARGLWRAGFIQDAPRLLIGVSLGSLVLIYALRHDLWHGIPDPDGDETFNLRYRAPLIPWLLLAAAGLRSPGLQRLLGLSVFAGLGLRLSVWSPGQPSALDLRLYGHERWVDRTVPLGEPLQRMPRLQGRPSDLQAAVRFLSQHEDRWPACRLHHLYETGRRIGNGLREGESLPPQLLIDTLHYSPSQEERRQLAQGIAWPLIGVEGEGIEALPERIAQGLPEDPELLPGLEAELLQASGRRAHRALLSRPETQGMLLQGACESLGVELLESWQPSSGSPFTFPQASSLAQYGAGCLEEPGFWAGLGRSWALRSGCSEAAVLSLQQAQSGLEDDLSGAMSEAYSEGCLHYRWREVEPP